MRKKYIPQKQLPFLSANEGINQGVGVMKEVWLVVSECQSAVIVREGDIQVVCVAIIIVVVAVIIGIRIILITATDVQDTVSGHLVGPALSYVEWYQFVIGVLHLHGAVTIEREYHGAALWTGVVGQCPSTFRESDNLIFLTRGQQTQHKNHDKRKNTFHKV
jgi:hypothetical protein